PIHFFGKKFIAESSFVPVNDDQQGRGKSVENSEQDDQSAEETKNRSDDLTSRDGGRKKDENDGNQYCCQISTHQDPQGDETRQKGLTRLFEGQPKREAD